MTKLSFAIAGAAALTFGLAGCNSSNSDALNTAQVNAANNDLNAMASNAAGDAANAEAVALGTQRSSRSTALRVRCDVHPREAHRDVSDHGHSAQRNPGVSSLPGEI